MPPHIGRGPLIGRQRELEALLGCLASARSGAGTVAAVAGEPGIGKTRLVTELAERAHGQGWTVLSGRAYEPTGMPPYVPIADVLGAYARTCPPAELRAQLGRSAPELARLLPHVRGRLPDVAPGSPLSPDDDRYRLFESVTDFLRAIAHSGPHGLLLIIDDLHHADAPTLLLFRHLAYRLAGAPLLLVGTYRTIDLDRARSLVDLLADLGRERLLERLVLAPLALEDTRTFVGALTGAPVAPAVTASVHRRTEGNPFFIEEVVRHLVAGGRDLADADHAAAAGWGIPLGVREVIGSRFAQLTAGTRRLLQLGAALGERFPLALIQEAAEMEPEMLAAALDGAMQAGMLREEHEGYRFSHALIRDVIYDELGLPLRQHLHLCAAGAVEAVYAASLEAQAATLATHYRRAGRAGDEKALAYAQQAAMVARATYAWEEEAGHWQAALDLLTRRGAADQAQHCELLLALGGARVRAGEHERGHEAYRRAAALARAFGLADHLARAALGQAEELSRPGFRAGGATDAADPVALLEEAVQAVGPGDGALHARALARLALELYMTGAGDRSPPLGHAALAMARRLDDPSTLAAVLHSAHKTLWGPDELEARLQITAELLELAHATGERQIALSGYNARIPDLLACGEIAAVDAAMAAYARLTEDLRAPPLHQHAVAVQRAMRRLLDGQLEEAEQLVHEAHAVGRRVQCPDTIGCFEGQILQLRRLQGRQQELDDERARSLEQAPHPWMFCAGRALIHSELGHVAAARREFEHLAADDFVAVPRTITWTRGLSNHVQLADACAFLGDARRAASLYERLLPYAGQAIVAGGAVICGGSVARPLGRLAAVMGRWDEATGHFEAALVMNDRMGARPWLAHTQRQYALLLARRRPRGDRRRARQLLGAALALYTEMAMDGFAAQTRALLADPVLVSLPPPAPRFPDGLTAREAEVLGLIAGGKSNRDISEQLVLSERTVGRHIANIYVKIGAHNRADAAAYALRHDLAPLTVRG